jgi:maltose/moltooligosaccharide transporter
MATRTHTQHSFWPLWNMCFGYLGIQFSFALQQANVSRIFQTLGASIEDLPLLSIAAPLTGLIVQPIVGYWSDRTWTGLGRRRPYLLAGAVFATIALALMPSSPSLLGAAVLLWVLDSAMNVSMEPFRALVADRLTPGRRSAGYAMQVFFISVGSCVASLMPWLLAHLGVTNVQSTEGLPDTVKYSFYVGAAVLLLTISWTVLRCPEYPQYASGKPPDPPCPPDTDGQSTDCAGPESRGPRARRKPNMFTSIAADIWDMPRTMQQLGVVQFFSWFALFAMWIYMTPAVTQTHFNATDPHSARYNEGANWVGILYATSASAAVIAPVLIQAMARRIGASLTHSICLCIGSLGLFSFLLFSDPHWLLLSMGGIGFACAAILLLPYALLSQNLPSPKMGVYMGIFNAFIVIPQLLAASTLGLLLRVFFGGAPIYALLLGGVSLLIAGLAVLWVTERDSRASVVEIPRRKRRNEHRYGVRSGGSGQDLERGAQRRGHS